MKIKTVLAILILTSIISVKGAGQDLLTEALIDSISNVDRALGAELEAVYQYNRAIKNVGMKDSVIVRREGDAFIYIYNGSVIDQILIAPGNKSPIQIHYTTNQYNRHLSASIMRSIGSSSYVHVSDEKTCDFRIQVRHVENEVQSGEYIEKCITGEIYEHGFYHQIDSIYQDSIAFFDPVTSINEYRYMDRTKYAKKCGAWITTVKGEIVKEIYQDCR